MKKILLSLLLLLIVTAMNAQKALNTERYDVNRDDVVNISDVTFLVNTILDKFDSTLESLSDTNRDVNRDGNITIADVTLLVNAILGKVNYPIKEIKMSNNLQLSVGKDKAKILEPVVTPADADYLTLQWASSNVRVATVDQTGKVTGISEGTCTITATAMDGSGVKATCGVTVSASHEYVDLGLPSGTLWATCNVGASKPEDVGDYFAWGETETKEVYDDWMAYKWYIGPIPLIAKYCNLDYISNTGVADNLMELEPEDDAAYVNWGYEWRMPSLAQIEELINSDYTTWTLTTLNGVSGRKITSKQNGNSIFLPSIHALSSSGYFWSRTLCEVCTNAYGLRFELNTYTTIGAVDTGWVEGEQREFGKYVRPVRNQQ